MLTLKNAFQGLFHRLVNAACLAWDTEEIRIRKTILVLVVMVYTALSFVWGSVYLLLDMRFSYYIPYGYGMVSIVTLVLLFYTKSYRLFRTCQLWIILLVPFLLQWHLGGFGPSGAVMIWSILSPIGALMFAGPRQSWPWFAGYIGLTLISGFINVQAADQALSASGWVCACFFVFNIGGVTCIAFFLLKYFVEKSEETIDELGEANIRVRREKDRIDKIKRMMAYFVPHTAQQMIEDGSEKALLKKYIRDATVLFLDIEGFSAMVKAYSYERINQTIEYHFSLFFDLIRRRGGDINETSGDGMMVIFLDEAKDRHAENAVLSAIDIQNACRRGKDAGDGDILPIDVNIGINSGEVYLGSTKIRSHEDARWTFTASGSVTVLAARLSDYAQGGKILIGAETAGRIKGRFELKRLQGVELKNVDNFGSVYEVAADS